MGVRLKAAGPAGLKAASVLLLAASVLLLAAGGWLLAGAFLRSITYGLAVVLLAASGCVCLAASHRGAGRAVVLAVLGAALALWAAWVLFCFGLGAGPAWHLIGWLLGLTPGLLAISVLVAGVRGSPPVAAALGSRAWGWMTSAWSGSSAARATAQAPAAASEGGPAARRTPVVRVRRSRAPSIGRTELPDLVVGYQPGLFRRPVLWRGSTLDRYRHGVVVAVPGTGKTSALGGPMIMQDLRAMQRGSRMGLIVIEPKGELAAAVAHTARSMGIPAAHIDPTRADSDVFNPLAGPAEDVAESIRSALRAMFGKQEAFFSLVQEQMAKNTVLLLKRLAGDDLTMSELLSNLQNPAKLRANVTRFMRAARPGDEALVDFFRQEVLSEAMADKVRQFAAGLRMQLTDLTTNPRVRRVLEGKSSVDLDLLLSEGRCVLAIGTGMGTLAGRLGELFGQLMVMSLQHAIFRRPGTEFTRLPFSLYIDEAPAFINPQFKAILEQGRSYKISAFLMLQNRQQLADRGGREFMDTVLANAQTKVVFGGLSSDDAKWFAGQFGMVRRRQRSRSYQRAGLLLRPQGEQHREEWEPVFDYTSLMRLPREVAVAQILHRGQLQPPVQFRTERVRWPESAQAYIAVGDAEDEPDQPGVPVGLATAIEVAAMEAAEANARRKRGGGGSGRTSSPLPPGQVPTRQMRLDEELRREGPGDWGTLPMQGESDDGPPDGAAAGGMEVPQGTVPDGGSSPAAVERDV